MQTKIDSSIWDDPEFESLDAEAKLAVFYLLTKADRLGCIEISKRRFEFETSVPFVALKRVLDSLPNSFKSPFGPKPAGDKIVIWVRNYIKRQFGHGQSLLKNRMTVSLIQDLRAAAKEVQTLILDEYPELYDHPGLKTDPGSIQDKSSTDPGSMVDQIPSDPGSASSKRWIDPPGEGEGEGEGEGTREEVQEEGPQSQFGGPSLNQFLEACQQLSPAIPRPMGSALWRELEANQWLDANRRGLKGSWRLKVAQPAYREWAAELELRERTLAKSQPVARKTERIPPQELLTAAWVAFGGREANAPEWADLEYNRPRLREMAEAHKPLADFLAAPAAK